MQRNYLRAMLVCLIPCLAAAAFAVQTDKYKLGIDLAGGTILVYEINLERTKQLIDARKGSEGPTARQQATSEGLSSDDMMKLASQIKRRIDPADLKNVTVRPLGNTRVEIILPTGGSGQSGRSNLTSEEIEEVKRLVSQMGVLEFRILANQVDDDVGIQQARALIKDSSPDEANSWAVRGVVPPAPAATYEVKAAGDKALPVRYSWVELAPAERESLRLQNALEASPVGLWGEAAKNRNQAFIHDYSNEGKSASMVMFSRAVHPASPSAQREVDSIRRAVAAGTLPESTIRDGGREKTQEEIYKEILANPAVGDKVEVTEGITRVQGPKRFEYYVLTRVSQYDNVKVGGEISLTANAGQDEKFNLAVHFTFNGAGAQAFGAMTERNKPTQNASRALAILLDERIVSAPNLNAVIRSQGVISGGRDGFSKDAVDKLVNFLRNGALNAQLREKPVSENTIGPTLGGDTIRKGTRAVGGAFLIVLIFMVCYYRFAGLVACVALLANLLLTVGFMVMAHAAFTLPGLAGIVLMLGMAVDANVLIYERLREERNKGANLATAIRNGYDRAFYTIIDTHLTSIFTSIVLYYLGNDQLKGFAISLAVGLIISLFTSLYMTRLLFDYWQHRHWLKHLKMLRLFERPMFNPMKYRFYFFTATSILTLLGLGLFLMRGESVLNVDFRGGTVYGGRLKNGEERALTATDKPGLRDLLSEERQREQLKVDSVRWVNRPTSGDIAAMGTYVYEITYADPARSRATVSLTEKPLGANEEEMARDVKDRAGKLPDISVEQIFLASEPSYPDGKSRYFTIRTTERQRDLVQVSLDRLLRDDKGGPLMDKTTMTIGAVTGPIVELTFDKVTSPNYTRDLLHQEFAGENALEGDTPFFLTGEGEGEDGRFKNMKLDVSKNPRFGALNKLAASATAGGPGGAAAVGSPAAFVANRSLQDPAAVAQLETLRDVLRKTEREFASRPVPERLEVFDSQLAAETQTRAFWAIFVSWIAILLYLWFRFGNWTFGLAAVLCLVHDLSFTLGAIAVCHYLSGIPGASILGIEDFKIDLAAVAALLTLVGYSVNEIIVNFARIREVRGKNPLLTPQMINDSVNQTLSRTILTSMTVLLVSGVLYWFGGEGVHLFAFVMVSGVLISTYSSIFVASPLLLFLGEGTSHESHEHVEEEMDKPEEEAVVEG
jgi:SecD/SecF fusion protein